MTVSRRMLAVLAVVFALAASIGFLGSGLADTPFASGDGADSQTPAEAQVQELADLMRREDRVVFEALVTGDPSQLPSVFYNDPTVIQSSDFDTALERAGDAVEAALAASAAGPVGADDGFLSAQVANIIVTRQNIDAWEAIEEQAAAEGRAVTEQELDSLPYGENPYPRKHASDWVEFPQYVFDVVIHDDHATAKRAFIDPEAAVGNWLENYPGYYVEYVFTRVDGQWYVSGETRVSWPFTQEEIRDAVPETDAA